MLIKLITTCYTFINHYLYDDTIDSPTDTQQNGYNTNKCSFMCNYITKPAYNPKLKKGYPYVCGYCLQKINLPKHRYDDRTYCSIKCRDIQISNDTKKNTI